MSNELIISAIENGQTSLGIELGSTRIKAVLIGPNYLPIASGAFSWENRFENGIWTYHLDDVWAGLQACYKNLASEVKEKFGVTLAKIGSIGFSAMMHGYLVFDHEDNQLAEFRTWRNTMTERSAEELTKLFDFNIPQRWSIAHLYQAILNNEPHVKEISHLTTLAGYVHFKLTGKKVLGVGEASGVFPIDSTNNTFNIGMIKKFNAAIEAKELGFKLEDILPQVLSAGDDAGELTEEGARLLDPSGALQAGVPLCPPEGDAGTGMVATNSVASRTGNVSAGTSIFAMIVLEKDLSQLYTEIDMVTTPSGKPVAMVHCNTCTSDLDAWIKLFGEVLTTMGMEKDMNALYETMYRIALTADADCGGLMTYNYFSGEPITGLDEGRPLFVRLPDAKFTLANFMRAQLYSTLATLKLGMDILFDKENVALDKLLGHGGFFKIKGVGQRIMAAAVNVPVVVMETAGEGGAWGIALLASYMQNKENNETLENFLSDKVFSASAGECVNPNLEDLKGFKEFMVQYENGLVIERAAVASLK